MIKFFEEAIRGGLSFACDRFVQADPFKALTHIDMVSFCGFFNIVIDSRLYTYVFLKEQPVWSGSGRTITIRRF